MVLTTPRRLHGEDRDAAGGTSPAPSLAHDIAGHRHPSLEGSLYRTLFGVLALMAAVLVVYASSVATIVDQWSESSFRHGYVVPLISLYILWRERADLIGVPWRASAAGLVLLALSVGLWIVAKAAFVQTFEHVAVLLMLNTTVLAVAGGAIYRRVAFALCMLALALPVGTIIVPVLMESTAGIASTLLAFVGIPVHRVGMVLTLPGGSFEVAEVCAGFRYLTSGLVVSLFASHLVFRSIYRRMMFVAVFSALMVLTNGIRAFVVMAIGSMTEMQWMTGVDHMVFGWLLFGAVMLVMCFVGERYSDVRPKKRPAS